MEGKGTDISSVKGNRCPRGKEYAINEFKCPVRTLTSSVAVRHGEQPVFSVRTTGPVPKDKIKECMGVITLLEMEAPIWPNNVRELANAARLFAVGVMPLAEIPNPLLHQVEPMQLDQRLSLIHIL